MSFARSVFFRYFLVWLVLVGAAFLAWHFWAPIRLLLGWEILIVLNMASFLLFGIDKLIAGGRVMRVPEKMLYLATLVGGSVGSLIAMNLFRHKTRKTSFQFIMALLVIVQIGLVWLMYRPNVGFFKIDW